VLVTRTWSLWYWWDWVRITDGIRLGYWLDKVRILVSQNTVRTRPLYS
jgi:hypothetical protein